ncbi:MAG: 2Fe-2S iron-sulfur cluster-binding protein [Actinomycetota bacterium]
MAPSFEFEGKQVPIAQGDTIASALYRAGVRTFTRSLKLHRRRGLYCLTGDCPNCLVSVDGVPGTRSCTTPADAGMVVEREDGWPSTDHDLMRLTEAAHPLMPVGFYYKTFIHPRFAWPVAEKIIRKVTGLGRLPEDRAPDIRPTRHVRADVLVVGAGVAGLAAAGAAAERGERVLICDEGEIGEKVAPGPTQDRIRGLADEVRGFAAVTVLERHTAVGMYDGPMVALDGPRELVQVHPGRVVVATGAVEYHGVFKGNDVPGVWQARGAARLAGVHGLLPGARAVAVIAGEEGAPHVATLTDAGVEIAAVVAALDHADVMPDGVRFIPDGRIVRTHGGEAVRAVTIETEAGRQRIACDALILSLGLSPRDDLLRMGPEDPVVGAGDVVMPGCSLDEAVESGHRAGSGEADTSVDAAASHDAACPSMGDAGTVCLCEDVSVEDLHRAWDEGYRSSEIVKRYTTATMGPCQGAMCGLHLACFAKERSGGSRKAGARTTSRPPARPVSLEALAGAVHEVIEKRTALHDRHLAAGARLDWSGSWKRPFNYGDWRSEYLAVRERVSLMDVGTLGKMLIGGRDAGSLVDRVFPTRIEDLAPGRSRYLLALGEAGYVFDDGLVCALDDGRYYLTSTSGGADGMERWLREWADRWALHANIVNQTPMLGAIVVAGPHARDLLASLSDDALDPVSFPYMAHREIAVAGVPCRAIRVGFVGELAYELHHPRSRGVELWDALMAAGTPYDIRPHGLDALELLRLEKGHVYLAQDTMPDDTPAKLGMEWAVAMDKPDFVGKVALERMAQIPLERKLVGLRIGDANAAGDANRNGHRGDAIHDVAALRGMPLYAGEALVGRITSCERSDVLGYGVGLGWLRTDGDGEVPTALRAGDVAVSVVPAPFYDPKGARLRA